MHTSCSFDMSYVITYDIWKSELWAVEESRSVKTKQKVPFSDFSYIFWSGCWNISFYSWNFENDFTAWCKFVIQRCYSKVPRFMVDSGLILLNNKIRSSLVFSTCYSMHKYNLGMNSIKNREKLRHLRYVCYSQFSKEGRKSQKKTKNFISFLQPKQKGDVAVVWERRSCWS